MPSYPWLAKNRVDDIDVQARMRSLQRLGVPYADSEITTAPAALAGRTEQDALIAYLQELGIQLRNMN